MDDPANILEWDFEEKLSEMEKSDEDCPRCKKAKLVVYQDPMITSVDAIVTLLICPVCRYSEKE